MCVFESSCRRPTRHSPYTTMIVHINNNHNEPTPRRRDGNRCGITKVFQITASMVFLWLAMWNVRLGLETAPQKAQMANPQIQGFARRTSAVPASNQTNATEPGPESVTTVISNVTQEVEPSKAHWKPPPSKMHLVPPDDQHLQIFRQPAP